MFDPASSIDMCNFRNNNVCVTFGITLSRHNCLSLLLGNEENAFDSGNVHVCIAILGPRNVKFYRSTLMTVVTDPYAMVFVMKVVYI